MFSYLSLVLITMQRSIIIKIVASIRKVFFPFNMFLQLKQLCNIFLYNFSVQLFTILFFVEIVNHLLKTSTFWEFFLWKCQKDEDAQAIYWNRREKNPHPVTALDQRPTATLPFTTWIRIAKHRLRYLEDFFSFIH